MNEVIKQRWVALGPRNYGKSIEWKLEGEPWDTEGLYADHTRGIYLLCLLLEAIQPLGWRLVSSAGEKIQKIIFQFFTPHYHDIFFTDISSKNLDANERGYALIGKPEDMHTWFFLYDESMRVESEDVPIQHNLNTAQYCPGSAKREMPASVSVPNLDQGEPENTQYFHHYIPTQQQAQQAKFMMYGHAQSVHAPTPPSPPTMVDHAHHSHHCSNSLNQHHSRSVPSVAAAVAGSATPHHHHSSGGGVNNDHYASRTSLNHEISSSRPQSRGHSHFCHQQGCDYPSG